MNRSNTNDCRLYVGNLPDDVRERELEDVFYKYGTIKDVELKLPKGRGTPYAFIEFDDPRYEDFSNICSKSFTNRWLICFNEMCTC